MKYDFDTLLNREGTNCEKLDKLESIYGHADIIPLWVADMDFAVAPEIISAMKRRLEHPILGYTYRPESYFRAIVDWVGTRNGWKIRPEWIDFVPGVVPGLVFAMRAFTAEGDGIVIQPPVYHPFSRQICFNKRVVVDNPIVRKDDRFVIDFEDLDRKLEGARAFMMSNPHNPTGRVFTAEELTRIGELCVKHDILILSDEIHSDIILKPHRHVHIAALSEEFAARTLTFIAPSKTFNIAGLSTASVIISNESLQRRLRNEFDKLHADQGNIFGNIASEAAYTHGHRWVDEMTAYVAGNADYVVDFLKRHIPSVATARPEGTYLMWLDFNRWKMSHAELCRFMSREAGLAMNEGTMFGEGGEKFMRMNVATSRSVIEQAMRQLLEAYRKLK